MSSKIACQARFRAAATLALLLLVAPGVGPAIAQSGTEPGDRAEAAPDWTTLSASLRVRPLTEKGADGLWLHESDTQWGSSTVAGNGLVVVGRDGAVVIDTPWDDGTTAVLLDWIARELRAPVLAVVATHFHPDAAGGLAEVHRRGIATWGHTLTGPLATAAGREAPRRSFDDRVSLSTGTEALEVFYPGPGHARDNVMVWFPTRHLLFAGCAAKAAAWNSLGFTGDADLERWPAALRAAAELEPEIVIPGHGDPGGPELLTHTLALLEKAAG